MKILSSFTHPQVVANLHEFLSSSEHKGKYFEERLEPNSCLPQLTSIVEKKIEWKRASQWCQSFNHSSKYLPLCSSDERNSYRFAKT